MTGNSKHLLLVEDEAPLRQLVAIQLTRRGYDVEQAATGEEALARLADFAFDLIVTDLRLPGIDGAAVVEAAVARYPDIVAIVVTGYGTVKDAVEAIKRGAWDFVSKPFQIDELLHTVAAALEQRRLKSENAYLRAQLDDRYRFETLIGKSPAMKKLVQTLETVAVSNSTILISGETGTGKEVVARAIHHNSPRGVNRFVALNCSAIPEPLQEAELFGHVRGAFTGAVGNRQGRLEQAHRGTLFLDEVGTMSGALQMKLLRVLQEREFERVGDSHTIKVDVRIIAATNSDLAQMVADGRFRDDLYYRLNVIPVELAPLRNRREDIPLLVRHFLGRYAPPPRAEHGQPVKTGSAPRESGPASKPSVTVSQSAMRRLMAHNWPGNVRQLENAIERAVAFSGGKPQIEVADLPSELANPETPALRTPILLPEDGLDLDAFVAGIERELIQRSLERTGGNKNQAARLLHLKRTTLVEKLKRLEPP
ncbi:MAG: response regulator [Luteitalea sp.]|nr:response regulator [Luteitalea sp.]